MLQLKANVNYKDSLFSSFLGEPWRLVEIYNAVEGTSYPPDTAVEINTLTDVLWKDQLNDLSFMLNGQIVVLIEHQSTVNGNMALRMLLYVARIYEKLLPEKSIYKRKRIAIPTPKFIVFYNGKEDYPEHCRQKLSPSFIVQEEEFALELCIDVYNINYQKSPQIIQKSQSLKEYSLFVHQVNAELACGQSFGQAVTKAIRYCMAHNIMKEYLYQNGSEVENMLFTEWNNETALEVWKEEALEDMQEQIEKAEQELERVKQEAEKERQKAEKERQEANKRAKEAKRLKEEGQEKERRAILALSTLLSPEILAEKFEVPLEFILHIQKGAAAAIPTDHEEQNKL